MWNDVFYLMLFPTACICRTVHFMDIVLAAYALMNKQALS
jgi:hypothetical protein